MSLRRLAPHAAFAKLPIEKDIGKKGRFDWLPLHQLFIDEDYQRPVAQAGLANIRTVALNFLWPLFAPVVCFQRTDKQFVIIDGQHRAIAAASRGDIAALPCIIHEGTPELEARAFAAINGIVTKINSLTVFRARLAAKEKGAMEIFTVCKAAGVTVAPYPKTNCAAGETLAIGTLEQCLRRFGAEPLKLALRIVTQTGDGHPGLLREGIIAGGVDVFFANPDWLKRADEVLAAVETFDLSELYNAAVMQKAIDKKAGSSNRSYFANALRAKLEPLLGKAIEARPDPAPAKALPKKATPADNAYEAMVRWAVRDGAPVRQLSATVFMWQGERIGTKDFLDRVNRRRKAMGQHPFQAPVTA